MKTQRMILRFFSVLIILCLASYLGGCKKPTYGTERIFFCHNILANLSALFEGDPDPIEDSVSVYINKIYQHTDIKGFIGSWQLVWGPVVHVAKLPWVKVKRPVNTMFIARNIDDPDAFVVSIAGTNPRSLFDWLIEDGWVDSMKEWPYGDPPDRSKTKISRGTDTGLSVLTAFKDPDTGRSARDYLSAQAGNRSRMSITVVGHSLGGALSPVYALYLHNTLPDWSHDADIYIACYPTAGATPGNKAFSDYYGQCLGDSTHRVYNHFDIVPHAWQSDSLKKIPHLYDAVMKPTVEIEAFVDIARGISAGHDYMQILPETLPHPGQIQVVLGAKNETQKFEFEAGYQHIDVYVNVIFQVKPFLDRVQAIIDHPHYFTSRVKVAKVII